MKVEGIDHVAIMVKDIDKAIQFFGELFDMEFEELPGAAERSGVRVAINRPEAQIEFMSVVDPVKAARFTTMEEGIFRIFLRVKDADEAVADAKEKGVPIERIMEEQQLLPFIPHFKELFFKEEDTPYKWLSLVWYATPKKV